jgi:hypothetical protein
MLSQFVISELVKVLMLIVELHEPWASLGGKQIALVELALPHVPMTALAGHLQQLLLSSLQDDCLRKTAQHFLQVGQQQVRY